MRFVRFLAVALVTFVALAAAQPAAATDYFVAPNGLPTNNGNINTPIDLTTALSANSPVRPGDTVWLREGVYVGVYNCVLWGTQQAPITVRQYPGERATLDGAGLPLDVLTVYGAWVTFIGFEIMNSDLQRTTFQDGPWPSTMHRGAGIIARGGNLKFINLVVHDNLYGAGVWIESVNTEVYGGIFTFNGWQGGDGSHGHGIYTQNDTGTRLLRENILFNQFSFGIQAYGSSTAFVDNITLEGNVIFNNGIVGSSGFERDILIGGGHAAHHPVLNENYTYGGAHTFLGYGIGCQDGVVTDNYFVGRDPFILEDCIPVMTGNSLYGLEGHLNGYADLPASSYPTNTYYADRPTTNFVKVRRNIYEPGRGHIVVYNWTGQGSVAVDLSPIGLAVGNQFEIRDAQNFYGPRVMTGIYNGQPIQLPMTGLTLAAPVGTLPVLPPHTAPEFGVFVVIRTDGGPIVTPQPEAAAPIISPGGGNFLTPQAVTMSTTTPGGEIRYTTDGSTPRYNSPFYTGAFTIYTSTTIRARTFAAGMIQSQTTTSQLLYSSGATASFVGVDTTTKGNWRGVYGSNGATVIGDTTAYPAYAQVTPSGNNFWSWSASTTDPRALQRSVGTDRTAATWYAYSYNVAINVTDGQPHRLTLYTIDWDNVPRTERIELYDGVTGILLDSRLVSGFSGGQYLTWDIAGRVTVRMLCSLGANAVLSGLFFDPIPGYIPPSAATPTINPNGGTFSAPVQVSLATATSGATIRFTTDGTTPTSASTLYSGSFSISSSSTVSARAFANGMGDSTVAVASIVISLPTVATPSISPPGGSFSAPVSVSLASSTAGALIRYTVDGSTPTVASPQYSGPFTVSTSTTVKAIASAANMLDSAVGSASFVVQLPTVATPTMSPSGGSFTTPVTVTLASATPGAVIRYTTDGSPPTSSSPAYTSSLTLSSTTTVKAMASAVNMLDSAIATATFSITAPPNSATFVNTDNTTKGTWRTVYGTEAAAVIGDVVAYPSYAQVTPSGNGFYSWTNSTADVRALQRTVGTGRLAATWYSGTSFTIQVNITDGLSHQLAFYCIDWDGTSRAQRFDVKDTNTGALLDSRTISNFNGGRYLLWRISGRVTITVTRTAGVNAVVNGLFFDPASGAPPATAATPTISPAGGNFTGPVTVSLASTTPGASIRYTTDGSTPNGASTLYTGPFSLTTSRTVKALASAPGLVDSPVAIAAFTIATAGSATFVKVDAATIGNWKTVYGTQGVALAGDTTAYPSYAQVTFAGQDSWTWAANTSEPRAPVRVVGSTRLAATWYTTTAFTIDVNFTDGQAHQLALYAMDWDSTIRSQRFEVKDPSTGTILDTRTLSGFNGGRYVVWRVTGRVLLTVTKLSGANAAVSGLFIDP